MHKDNYNQIKKIIYIITIVVGSFILFLGLMIPYVFAQSIDNLKKEISEKYGQVLLLKIYIPDKESDLHDFLKALNRMNINHLTLFPDIGGASSYCNAGVRIPKY